MFRAKSALLTLALAGVLTLSTGCEDKKNRIVMLEESNQQLLEDLNAAQDELAAMRSANDQCQSNLSAAHNQNSNLTRQLADARNQPRPQPIIQQAPQPQVPSGWTAVPGGAMIAVEGSVLFDPGKAKLRGGATGDLSRIAEVIRREYPSKDILVYGHTDNTPIKKSGWKDNLELSTERASSVVRWLSKEGISSDRLVACGCGDSRPRVPNSNEANRKQNRRVEIFALDADIQTASRR
ncbi:MAG TPA: OmpA family protein [Phycisphaerae bacterium]|nr:OmpA family protein [Phycisphaerae bacterium]